MANVTRRNFDTIFAQVERDILSSDFVAFDLEMTGIHSTQWRRSYNADTLELRYLNIRHSVQHIAVLQCGICTFKWDDKRQALSARPYNFNLFPGEVLSRKAPMRAFLCETASLRFLASHNFDFNACIYHGIPYLSEAQEEAARIDLGLDAEASSLPPREESKGDIPLNLVGDVLFSENIKRRIFEWRDHLAHLRQLDLAASQEQGGVGVSTAPPSVSVEGETCEAGVAPGGEGEEPEASKQVAPGSGPVRGMDEYRGRPVLRLAGMSRHQQALVRQVLRKTFPDVMPLPPSAMSDLADGISMALVGNKDARRAFEIEMQKELRSAKEQQLKEAVGFRRVIDVISRSGKPLVGHNCAFDLLHLHHKFIGPLPPTPEEFAMSLHERLPFIVDTKHLLRAHAQMKADLAKNGSTLEVVYKRALRTENLDRMRVDVDPDFERYISTDGSDGSESFKHEAGFDAYMTGVIFAQACHLAGVRSTSFTCLAPPKEANLLDHPASSSPTRTSSPPTTSSPFPSQSDNITPPSPASSLPRPAESTAEGHTAVKSLGTIRQLGNVLTLGQAGDLLMSLVTGRQVAPPQISKPFGFAIAHDRSNVALLWGFPSTSTERDLKAVVARVCGAGGGGAGKKLRMNIVFVDLTSALLEFEDRVHALRFWTRMVEAEGEVKKEVSGDGEVGEGEQQWQRVRASGDKERQAALEAVSMGMRAGSFGVYERLCRTPAAQQSVADLLDAMFEGERLAVERREEAHLASASLRNRLAARAPSKEESTWRNTNVSNNYSKDKGGAGSRSANTYGNHNNSSSRDNSRYDGDDDSNRSPPHKKRKAPVPLPLGEGKEEEGEGGGAHRREGDRAADGGRSRSPRVTAEQW